MAKREERNNKQIFLQVKHHSLVEESKTPREGFEKIEVENPKLKAPDNKVTKYIDRWGAVTGFITKIEQYDTQQTYDTRYQGIKIHLDDEIVLDLPYKTPSYDSFAKAVENIDLTKEVTFSAYYNRTKDRTGFSIQQNGVPVGWKYTKDDMGDCPVWEKDLEGEWDSRAQRAFLKARIADVVIPAVATANVGRPEKALAASAGASTASTESAETTNEDVDESDVPF